jgi:hypothetical protein
MGRGAIVLDPLSSGWGNAKIVNNTQELLDASKNEENKLLVVDESALSLDRYNSDELWLAKTARHHGHSSIFIGQEWIDVPKGIRSQCRQVFVFACMRDESKELANRYNSDLLLDAHNQRIGEFIRVIVNQEATRGRVDFKMGKIMLTNGVK